jgi:hypothetical protein
MPLNSNLIKYVIGDSDIIDRMEAIPALQPFEDTVMDYLDSVSKILLSSTEAKQYPDVITFAFWCRKASMKNVQKPYAAMQNRLGRGIAFHIAPSNVAVNFAYSFVAGLLSGNANIVRLPSKDFDQVRMICDAMRSALDSNLRNYICFIQYEHNQEITDYLSSICDTRIICNQEITDYLSSICDTRIIWGGDQTIATIRRSLLKARANEITFADRYSICLIHSEEYLKEPNKKSIAQGFYNDTYLTDQNACTSPRLIVWMGEKIKDAQETFWNELYKLVEVKYPLQPVHAVSKYSNLCLQAASNQGVQLEKSKDNLILRIKVDSISKDLMKYKGNCGFFMEYEAKQLEELLPLFTSQLQTISYYGYDTKVIQNVVKTSGARGIDRIVPIGKTMDFALVWDGYDLIRSLSREIVIG